MRSNHALAIHLSTPRPLPIMVMLWLSISCYPPPPTTDRSMPRFKRSLRLRRRSALSHPGTASASAKPSLSWWVLATLGLLLIAVPILLLNKNHSGDRLKIRRELRKF
jgi:hypothetical protein